MALHRWQWADYAAAHADRRNLWIHIVAVPVFLLGNLLAVALPVLTAVAINVLRELNGESGFGAAIALPFLAVLPGLAISAIAIGVQGAGHKREAQPPHPFTGPLNVVGRILTEQWMTFPRFVLSGGWLRALRQG